MSKYFLTRDQIRKLFIDGPLNTQVSRTAALLPFSLIAIGMFRGFFFGVEYTDNQIILGFGSLFLLTVWLPFAFQRPVRVAKD